MSTIKNADKRGTGRILLNTQMIADDLTDMNWQFFLNSKDRTPVLRGFELYRSQTEFDEDIIYILAKGRTKGFPVDRCPYITSENVFGAAPHIRGVKKSDTEIINAMISIFERYHQFESDINDVLLSNGSLNDLCAVGIRFFHNPIYIHDRMFTIIALPEYKEGMLQFERSEDGNNIHVPLWLINDFKFDEAYHDTLTKREASIWGKDQFPRNMRSLYVNLWDGDYYNGRLLINELDTALKPGQFRLAEIFAEYVKIILHRDMKVPGHHFRDYEDTIRMLIKGEPADPMDVNALLDILGWDDGDSYICIKIQSQNPDIQIMSDSALRSQLTFDYPHSFDFFYEGRLCVIINFTKGKRDAEEIKASIATLIRDSYMYCGISCPIKGIRKIRVGFSQADITLKNIEITRNRWLMIFNECALDYMIDSVIQQMPAYNLVAPELLKLNVIDREKNTDYYHTLRVYLENERSIPRTSEALIIHRTTLQYRLEKIEQLTRLNLDSEDVRIYLMLSYKILNYVNIMHISPS
ncbi:MAG: helix-turn-helix domain-containing protein [Firmicutes bacterium]|nr:helix-turn-helix domain-containing protein [Bacillota bacterium]